MHTDYRNFPTPNTMPSSLRDTNNPIFSNQEIPRHSKKGKKGKKGKKLQNPLIPSLFPEENSLNLSWYKERESREKALVDKTLSHIALPYKALYEIVELNTEYSEAPFSYQHIPSNSNIYFTHTGFKIMREPLRFFMKTMMMSERGLAFIFLSACAMAERVEVPVRGRSCLHTDVFDLAYFIYLWDLNSKERGACPFCLKEIRIKDLVIDRPVQSALKEDPAGDLVAVSKVSFFIFWWF